eukprot:gnl/MRDRNA2_/MRDRNA2_141464_c0_seq1.p1 gnl/MRDRNA2_/MRDRNA2_141464_c0~~gnl/MRDRNA2_/MRDRNA2_141464_c0_seq1.p1  ORF type:complete len:427 (-),score=72.51 gnl/MRDRNA2_/MRDRNA2_141464_c0_seq1:348-1628(-)
MDKYNRIRKLGEGASGKVYLIENRENGELSVAKQINSVINEKDRTSAVQEAKLLKSLCHPNIVMLQDIFMTTSGKVLIIMDYADGGDLTQRIEEQRGKGLLPEIQCLEWLVQAGFALFYLHERKVLHRDIKTRNLFLYSSGLLKLGDFGISCVLDTTLAMAHTVVGTLYYLSPELVKRTPYSFKSDVWALGVVLYELAALKQPFDSKSLHELLHLIIKGKYEPLDASYSQSIKSLVHSMLSQEPASRPSVKTMLRMPSLKTAINNVIDRYGLGLEIPAEHPDSDEISSLSADIHNNAGYVPPLLIPSSSSQAPANINVAKVPSSHDMLGSLSARTEGHPALSHPSSYGTKVVQPKRAMYPPPGGCPPGKPPPGPPPGCSNEVMARLAAKANALPLFKPQVQAVPRAVLQGAGKQVLMASNHPGTQN